MNTGVCLMSLVHQPAFLNMHQFQRISFFSSIPRYTFSNWTTSTLLKSLNIFFYIRKKCLYFWQGPKHTMKIKGNCHPMDRSAAISGHLETVEIRCEVVDKRVLKVLKYLSTFNIRKEHTSFFSIFQRFSFFICVKHSKQY